MNVSTSARKVMLAFFVSFAVMAFAAANSSWAQTPQPAPAEQKPAEKPAEAKPKLVGNNLGLPANLGQEIAKVPEGKGKGQIDPSAPRGVFGIPGAPQISWILLFLWATWVGWIFSTVGAFGGIMAGVGHMTVYGLGDYVRTFRDTRPGSTRPSRTASGPRTSSWSGCHRS